MYLSPIFRTDYQLSEGVRITLKLDQAAEVKHRRDIKILNHDAMHIEDGDTLTLSYAFHIDYFGNVAAHLEVIERIICDESVVKSVRVDELIHGRSVIISVVERLTRLIDKLEKR